jgi:type IV pilus assembly protein PilV
MKSNLKKTTINLKFLIFNSHTGFTLMETLIAVSVLTIGLLGVTAMQLTSVSGNVFSNEMSVATELGQDLLEKLKASQYTSLVEDSKLTEGDHTNDELGQPNPIDSRGLSGDDVPLRIYTRIWTVTDDGFGLNSNMKTITVTVSWVDKERQQLGLPAPEIKISGIKPRE